MGLTEVLDWLLKILVDIFVKLGLMEVVPTSIETEEAVREWLEELLGFPMDGEDEIFNTSIPYIEEVNEYGYLGAPVSTVIDGVSTIIGMIALAECQVVDEYEILNIDNEEDCKKQGWAEWKDGKCRRQKSGHLKFHMEFDPNNGFVYHLWIHPDFRNETNQGIGEDQYGDRKPFTDNPDYEKYLQPRK